MSFVHVMLEVYCGYSYSREKKEEIPKFCKKGTGNPRYYCIENECPFVSYTIAPNEIAYVGQKGEVNDDESWIGFGGEMEADSYDEKENKKLISIWEEICKRKIVEAYDEYMRLKNSID